MCVLRVFFTFHFSVEIYCTVKLLYTQYIYRVYTVTHMDAPCDKNTWNVFTHHATVYTHASHTYTHIHLHSVHITQLFLNKKSSSTSSFSNIVTFLSTHSIFVSRGVNVLLLLEHSIVAVVVDSWWVDVGWSFLFIPVLLTHATLPFLYTILYLLAVCIVACAYLLCVLSKLIPNWTELRKRKR